MIKWYIYWFNGITVGLAIGFGMHFMRLRQPMNALPEFGIAAAMTILILVATIATSGNRK